MENKGGLLMSDINVNVNTESAENQDVNKTVADNSVDVNQKDKGVEEQKQENDKVEVPEKQEVKKPVKNTGNKKTKADLQAQIDMLQAELNNVVDNSADFNEQINAKDAEISKLNNQVADYLAQIEALNQAVNSIIEDKKNKLPANMKNLIPENQDAITTLNWLLKAEGNVTQENPEVQIGRVIPVDRTQINNSKDSDMSPYEKMTSAFAQLFSKK